MRHRTALMPLDTIEDPFELSLYESVKHDFVIFYASRDDDGKMWCPVSYSACTVPPLGETLPCRPPSAQSRAPVPYCACVSPHILIRRHRRHQDCRNVEEIIERTFAPADGPTGLIVYVGQRTECVR